MNILLKRTRIIYAMIFMAMLSIAFAYLSGMNFQERRGNERYGDIVLPKFEADVTAAQEIKVTTKEGDYHLRRVNMDWFLAERGEYPIRLNAIADLSEALSSMTYTRQMTQDPKKFDRLGLGDPYTGGTGALMEVFDINGATLAKLIVGFKNGAAYVRAPDEVQTWGVDASVFPPLQNPARWLDLDIIALSAGDIARVEVEIENARPYSLEVRADAPGKFKLEPPYDDALLIADYAPNAPALALAQFTALDAVALSELGDMQRVGVHRTITHQGLVIEAEIFRHDGEYWLTFAQSLQVERDETMAQIQEVEERVAGWAFKISRLDYNTFTTRLEDIIAR